MSTYYVRTTGSDANPGTSAGAAFATMAKLIATLAGGDVGYVGAGTYREAQLTCANSGNGVAKAITGATNATPIVVTCAGHGFANGQAVTIVGVQGNTAANGGWRITSVDASTFSLDGSAGNGTYTAATGSAYSSIGVFADVEGGWTGDAGQVRITSVTAESGGTTPAGTQIVKCNGKSWWLWQNFLLDSDIGQDGVLDSRSVTGAIGWTLRGCSLINWIPGNGCIWLVSTGGATNWFIDRCILSSTSSGSIGPISVTLPLISTGGGDYDSYIWITNSLLYLNRSGGIQFASSGSGTFHGGGVRFLNDTFIGGEVGIYTLDSNISGGVPIRVYNCRFQFTNICLAATAAGQIVEDYNLLQGSVIRQNVAIGAHSRTGIAYIDAATTGHEWLVGRQPRAPFSPNSESALLGFCQAPGTLIGGDVVSPSVDIMGRRRPAGASSTAVAAGCAERHDTGFIQTLVTHTAGMAMQIAGPGDHYVYANIDPATTTIGVFARYDTVGQPPTVTLKANSALGMLADVALTWADPGPNAWGLFTGVVTPSGRGVLTLQLATSLGVGNCFFDDLRFL